MRASEFFPDVVFDDPNTEERMSNLLLKSTHEGGVIWNTKQLLIPDYHSTLVSFMYHSFRLFPEETIIARVHGYDLNETVLDIINKVEKNLTNGYKVISKNAFSYDEGWFKKAFSDRYGIQFYNRSIIFVFSKEQKLNVPSLRFCAGEDSRVFQIIGCVK